MEVQQQRVPLITQSSKVQNGNSANNANTPASCNCGATTNTNPNTSTDLSKSSQMPKPSLMSVSVLPKNKVKESSAQTSPTLPTSSNNIDEETTIESKEIGTQTKTQWLQISLNSPPLSLTQEVPDVAL